MLWTLTKHCVMNNLLDQRFFSSLALVLLFCGVGSALSWKQYEERLQAADRLRHEADQQANLENVKMVRPPAAFSFLADGGEDRLPRYLVVSPDFIDEPVEDISQKPLGEAFRRLDWVFAVVFFYGLMTILLSYDWISGKREGNLLTLLLSSAVSRNVLIVSGFLGTLLTVLSAAAAGFLLYLLPPYFSGLWQPTASDFPPLLATFAASAVFLGTVAASGILASVLFRRSAVSLAFAFLLWMSFTVVLPTGIEIGVRLLAPAPSFSEFHTRVRTARAVYVDSLRGFYSMDIAELVNQPGLSEKQKLQRVQQFESEVNRQNSAAAEDFKASLARLRTAYLREHEERENLKVLLDSISPAALLRHCVESLLAVGRMHLDRFRLAAADYMREYTAFVEHERERRAEEATRSGFGMEESGFLVRSTIWKDFSAVPLDPRHRPPTVSQLPDPSRRLDQALRSLAVLLAFNLGVLGWVMRRFSRDSLTG